ncbi:MAG: flagellar biosynthetic protein FliR [Planctomycetota bacterium]
MIDPGYIEAFGLHLARASALVVASPLLGTASELQGYKVALIVSFAVTSFALSGGPLAIDPDTLTFAVMAMRELAIGLTLAFFLHLIMAALRVGTELVGQEMAFTLAGTVDPMTGNSNPPLTYLYEVLFYLALLSVNGHHWLVRGLMASYERAPVGALPLGASVPGLIVSFFSETFSAGIAFAAPVLVLLFMVSILIAILARAVPQINVLEFGFSARILTGLIGLALFAPIITPAFTRLLERLMRGLDAGLDALGTA